MKYLTGRSKKLKVGKKYYFVETDFGSTRIKSPTITKRTVYRIVTGDFSTKEPDDRYEVERYMAFESEDEARKYAIKELSNHKKYLNEEINRVKKLLTA